jgi:hypothetical protein
MPTCWCQRCAVQRREDWPKRAGVEVREALLAGCSSLICELAIAGADRPGLWPDLAPPEAFDRLAARELQLLLKRLRKAGLGVRYLARIARRAGSERTVALLLHATSPGALPPGELLSGWPGRCSVLAAPGVADLARALAPRCDVVRVVASIAYGGGAPRRQPTPDGLPRRRGRPPKALSRAPALF